MSTTVQPVKTRQRLPYIKIGNTEFVYYYDNDILYFKSGTDKISPVGVNKETYLTMLSLNEKGLKAYVFQNYGFASYRLLAQKFVELAKSGIITFFDVNVADVACGCDFDQKTMRNQPIERRSYIEPEINKLVREALRRTNPENNQPSTVENFFGAKKKE